MLVRIPAKGWVIPVRISPAQVGHPHENTWVMLVGNDKRDFLKKAAAFFAKESR